MKLLGFEFAPFSLPLERRLQTFAACLFSTSIVCLGLPTISIFIYLLFTKYFFIPLLYLAWIFYDVNQHKEGGRRCEFVRRWRIWKHLADYFPIKMIKTADLDPNKNYIFGYHPHGILTYGGFSCFATEGTNFSQAFPGITPRLLSIDAQFWIPFHREHIMSAGICSVSRESMEWILTKEGKGNALVIVIGGVSEALDAHPGNAILTMKRRKGFVKLALQHGASLVPVFGFGENDVFKRVHGSILRRIQEKLKSLIGYSFPLYYGRGVFQYTFGAIPHRKPIHVIIGKPISVEKTPEPTEEDINILHEKYVDGLTSLFEEYKPKYGPDVKLKLI